MLAVRRTNVHIRTGDGFSRSMCCPVNGTVVGMCHAGGTVVVTVTCKREYSLGTSEGELEVVDALGPAFLGGQVTGVEWLIGIIRRDAVTDRAGVVDGLLAVLPEVAVSYEHPVAVLREAEQGGICDGLLKCNLADVA